MKRMLTCALLVILGIVLAHPAAAAEEPGAKAQGEARSPSTDRHGPTGPTLEEYRIGPEDMLQISVWKNEPMSRIVPVRPDGMISLPLVNEIRAAGLTPEELRDVLLKKLTEFMPAPEVSVIVTQVNSYKVSVIGEVRKPAQYELKTWTTVLDVLALAGGFNEFASRTRIVILRPNGKTMERIPFNYNKVISAGGEQENFYLRPGDIVLVP